MLPHFHSFIAFILSDSVWSRVLQKFLINEVRLSFPNNLLNWTLQGKVSKNHLIIDDFPQGNKEKYLFLNVLNFQKRKGPDITFLKMKVNCVHESQWVRCFSYKYSMSCKY